MMQDAVLVSVVIPTFNAERYLKQAVESVLGQTLAEVEVIVVDDGSTDGTPQLMTSFGSRVSYVRFEQNRGPGAARNEGIRRSRGKYVALLDADDYFLPERLEKLVVFLESHPEFGFATSDAFYMFDDEPSDRTYFNVPGLHFWKEDQEVHIFESNFVGNKLVFRRQLFALYGFYDESLWFEDWAHNIDFIMGGERCGLLPEPLAIHRVRPGSLTTRSATVLEDRQTVLEEWLRRGLGKRAKRAAVRTLAEVRWSLVWTDEVRYDRGKVRQLLFSMILEGPPLYKLRAILLALLPLNLVARIREVRARAIYAGEGHWALHAALPKLRTGDYSGAYQNVRAAALFPFSLRLRLLALAWLMAPPLRSWLSRLIIARAADSEGRAGA